MPGTVNALPKPSQRESLGTEGKNSGVLSQNPGVGIQTSGTEIRRAPPSREPVTLRSDFYEPPTLDSDSWLLTTFPLRRNSSPHPTVTLAQNAGYRRPRYRSPLKTTSEVETKAR